MTDCSVLEEHLVDCSTVLHFVLTCQMFLTHRFQYRCIRRTQKEW
uniref:Uncharacterized protein n=1 Tax=Arundo donax TaxID=35708 RepID=A0A0A9GCP2_ARUDO